MRSFITNMILGGINNSLMIFFICGVISYLIDYRVLQAKPEYARAAAISKVVSIIFMVGSIMVFIVLHILDWIF